MISNKDKLKRKKILNLINKIKIKINSFSFIDFTILISLFLIIFSILTPWFSITNSSITETIFSNIFWITWYITIILIIVNFFFIFSKNTKQKIKLFFNNSFSDNSFFILSSIIFIILSLNSYITLKNWINLFTNEIKIHIWITSYLIAIILYSISIFLKLKQKNTNSSFILINESKEDKKHFSEKKLKNIMKLPFE